MEKKELYLVCPPEWHYELSVLIRQVYPFARIGEEPRENQEGIRVAEDGSRAWYFSADGRCLKESADEQPEHLTETVPAGDPGKNRAKRAVYQLLERPQPWGILTGVRPSKVAYRFLDEGKSVEEICRILETEYKLREDKARLAARVAEREHSLLADHRGTDVSIYIGIPFCPTRCSYCSFISNDKRAYDRWGDAYCDALEKESRASGPLVKGRRIQSFYMGGGTPTTLTAPQLRRILTAAEETFGLSSLREVTVEAGRPDTITGEKLQVLKDCHVDRLSVNPQTMHQETLDRIGRRHTAEQIFDAFRLARNAGFTDINMDFILGLPGEEPEQVAQSMEAVRFLRPENLTIHTLAVKRASVLNETGEIPDLVQEADRIEQMLSITAKTARDLGLEPYYMYRQKNMAGNFENVGYSLPGKECLYNIEIMEERQTILALGAGGITKVYYPEENRIERIANVKTPDEYVRRIDEMIERKREGGIRL